MTGVVIRRDELARNLGLPNESLMVELAILRGNDYLPDPRSAELEYYYVTNHHHSKGHATVQECIQFLRERQDEEDDENDDNDNEVENGNHVSYQVTSLSPDTQEKMKFIRALYNLQNLDEFALQDPKLVEQQERRRLLLEQSMDSDCTMEHDEMVIPDNLDGSLAKVQPLTDRSVKDAVLRCLQHYVHQQQQQGVQDDHIGDDEDDDAGDGSGTTIPASASGKMNLTQEHIDVFANMTLHEDLNEMMDAILAFHPRWRPQWSDVPAVYLIEKTIAMSLKLSADCPLVRLCPPYSLFDAYRFHMALQLHRQEKNVIRGNTVKGKAVVKPAAEPPVTVVERPVLPIDEHEEVILQTVRDNRVTIIQGGTGCGKSSRLPAMLLRAPAPDGSKKEVKLFISQPRRIAAKALVERLRSVEPDLKECFALRMGHGVREYENSNTRAWFVTTGYLVRLLANMPERFNDVSYLIIDEVHERSVDTDILCLLCRRLLITNVRIRLILMSATLAAQLYQEYFNAPPPIVVGARRFPVQEVYVDELLKTIRVPPKIAQAVAAVVKECNRLKCKGTPGAQHMEKLYTIVTHLAVVLGQPGSSVLIFVPGMNDIVAIQEAITALYVVGVRYSCVPIHSDIPFEDQMLVFQPSAEDEVKIIIATNSAESSVTLPDVDNVICLGLCKQITYNELSHRQMLTPTWISRASATQRAGRTGRLRPGTVYRLYTRDNFCSDMEPFEPGEMLRIPLDSVILMLRGILTDEAVTNVLQDCLEPPSIKTIDQSFQSLHKNHFITAPGDFCEITTLGRFVSELGIDLALGSLIGLGVQYGVAAEAIQMAGILSFPQSPWIMSNPLIHEAKSFNETVKKTFISKCHFDANLFSEPLATMNALWEFERVDDRDKAKWCWKNSMQATRVRRLSSTCKNLRQRVADFFEVDESAVRPKQPPTLLPHAMITILRCIQAWVFNETMIECNPAKFLSGISPDGMQVKLKSRSDHVTSDLLNEILDPDRHQFRLEGLIEIVQEGNFSYQRDFSVKDAANLLQQRFISYAAEKGLQVVAFWDKDTLAAYISDDVALEKISAETVKALRKALAESVVVAIRATGKHRGVGERSCGLWVIEQEKNEAPGEYKRFNMFRSKPSNQAKKMSALVSKLMENVRAATSIKGLMCYFSESKKNSFANAFRLTTLNVKEAVSDRDLKDLLSALHVDVARQHEKAGKQTIFFPHVPSSLLNSGTISRPHGQATYAGSSWERPLFECIPEGARLLSILASSRRREHVVILNSRTESEGEGDDDEESETFELYPDADQTKISSRWKRFNSSSTVYIPEHSVPGSALPIKENQILICCAANTLEIKGGAVKAEGLTLLPPGRLFFLLTRLTFGLFNEENLANGTLTDKCTQWLQSDEGQPKTEEKTVQEWHRRLQMAIEFHEAAMALGEELTCFPEMIRRLVAVFDGIDGYQAGVWDVDSNPFTKSNLSRLKRECRRSVLIDSVSNKANPSKDARESKSNGKKQREGSGSKGIFEKLKQKHAASKPHESTIIANGNAHVKPEDDELAEAKLILAATNHLDEELVSNAKKSHAKSKKALSRKENAEKTLTDGKIVHPAAVKLYLEAENFKIVESFELSVLEDSQVWLTTVLPSGSAVSDNELPSSNILALIIQHVRQSFGSSDDQMMNLHDGRDWKIYSSVAGDRTFYQAAFINRDHYSTRRLGRTDHLSTWLNDRLPRPANLADALDCIPPTHRRHFEHKMALIKWNGSQQLVFEDIESAIRMQAAFWLELQFRTRKKHWFQQDLANLISRLESDSLFKFRQN